MVTRYMVLLLGIVSRVQGTWYPVMGAGRNTRYMVPLPDTGSRTEGTWYYHYSIRYPVKGTGYKAHGTGYNGEQGV